MMDYNTFSVFKEDRNGGVPLFVKSDDYKVYVSKRERPVPVKKIETVDIPGRRDPLIYDYNEYENTTITYHCFCTEGYPENVQKLFNELMSCNGWVRLEDTYMDRHNSEYTYGYFAGGTSFDEIANYTAGSFDIVFNVIPKIYGFNDPIYIYHGDTDEPEEETYTAPEGYVFKYYPNISFDAEGPGSIEAYDPFTKEYVKLTIRKAVDDGRGCYFDAATLTLTDGWNVIEDEYWTSDDFYFQPDQDGNIVIRVNGPLRNLSIYPNYYKIV